MGDPELSTLIAERKRSVERLEAALDGGDVPPENRPNTLGLLHEHARWVGDLSALDGCPGPAAEWFDAAVRYGRRHIQERAGQADDPIWEGRARTAIDLLYDGVLARNDERLAEAVAATRAMSPVFPERFPDVAPWYHYARALTACIDGETGVARDHRSAMFAASEHVTADAEAFFDALGQVLDGFVAGDGRQLTAGIEALIRDLSASEDDPHYVRVPASALAELGTRRGLSVAAVDGHVYDHVRG